MSLNSCWIYTLYIQKLEYFVAVFKKEGEIPVCFLWKGVHDMLLSEKSKLQNYRQITDGQMERQNATLFIRKEWNIYTYTFFFFNLKKPWRQEPNQK